MEQSLSPEQARFAALLADYPWLFRYWDFDQRVCHEDELRTSLNVISSGEQHLARFFLGLWCGTDERFDMLEAASVLEGKERLLLINWLHDPFWP
ncbi:TPA: hypothetical protein ACIAIE_005598 [Serratia fonticola]